MNSAKKYVCLLPFFFFFFGKRVLYVFRRGYSTFSIKLCFFSKISCMVDEYFIQEKKILKVNFIVLFIYLKIILL